MVLLSFMLSNSRVFPDPFFPIMMLVGLVVIKGLERYRFLNGLVCLNSIVFEFLLLCALFFIFG